MGGPNGLPTRVPSVAIYSSLMSWSQGVRPALVFTPVSAIGGCRPWSRISLAGWRLRKGRGLVLKQERRPRMGSPFPFSMKSLGELTLRLGLCGCRLGGVSVPGAAFRQGCSGNGQHQDERDQQTQHLRHCHPPFAVSNPSIQTGRQYWSVFVLSSLIARRDPPCHSLGFHPPHPMHFCRRSPPPRTDGTMVQTP